MEKYITDERMGLWQAMRRANAYGADAFRMKTVRRLSMTKCLKRWNGSVQQKAVLPVTITWTFFPFCITESGLPTDFPATIIFTWHRFAAVRWLTSKPTAHSQRKHWFVTGDKAQSLFVRKSKTSLSAFNDIFSAFCFAVRNISSFPRRVFDEKEYTCRFSVQVSKKSISSRHTIHAFTRVKDFAMQTTKPRHRAFLRRGFVRFTAASALWAEVIVNLLA